MTTERRREIRWFAARVRMATDGPSDPEVIDALREEVESFDHDDLDYLRLCLADLDNHGLPQPRTVYLCPPPRPPVDGEWDGDWDDAVRTLEGG